MLIHWQALSPDAFQGVVEAYVLASVSEVGDLHQSLASKTKSLMQEIEAGKLLLWFDPDESHVSIITPEQAKTIS